MQHIVCHRFTLLFPNLLTRSLVTCTADQVILTTVADRIIDPVYDIVKQSVPSVSGIHVLLKSEFILREQHSCFLSLLTPASVVPSKEEDRCNQRGTNKVYRSPYSSGFCQMKLIKRQYINTVIVSLMQEDTHQLSVTRMLLVHDSQNP